MTRAEDGNAGRHDRLLAEARFVREAIGRRHSDKFVRLFDFVVSRTLEGQPPTEVEVANEVFSTGKIVEAPQDAAVRVCVHRLRKTMDEIYAGHQGLRLLIPRGEYSVVLSDDDEADNDPQGGPATVSPANTSSSARPWFALVLLLSASAAALWMVWPHGRDSETAALAGTALWHSMATDRRATTVALGDYYLFAQSAPSEAGPGEPPRLVWDPAITAREDLDLYLMWHPEETRRVADLDQHYVPSSSVVVLGRIFTAMRGLKKNPRHVDLVPASQLTPDLLKASDIVYVGQLSGLGSFLRDPLFQASGFKVGTTYDELIDSASGKHYRSDGAVITDERIPRRDFGYIASLPGPSGNHIVIIAGTRDPGLLEMAELASDPARLKSIAPRAPDQSEGFEALYQVRTMGNLNLGSKLLVRRSLHSRGVWDNSTAAQRFPNDTYEGGGHTDR